MAQEGGSWNIFISYGPLEDDSEADAPPPTPEERWRSFRACDEGETGPVGIVNFFFTYNVETNMEEISSGQEDDILRYVNAEIINSIYEEKCGRRRLELPARKLRIESISSGTADRFSGTCVATDERSADCRSYDGSLRVGFNDIGADSTHTEVGNTLVDLISKDMELGAYVAPLNMALQENWEGLEVTKLEFVSTSFFDDLSSKSFSAVQSSQYAQSGGLNALGNAFVPICVMLFLGVIAACYMARKSLNQRRNRELATLFDDSDLYMKDGGTIDTADMTNLGKLSRQHDVHVCNRIDCRACNRLPPKFDQDSISGGSYMKSVETTFDEIEPDSIFVAEKTNTHKRFGLNMFSFMRYKNLGNVRVTENSESVESWEDEPSAVNFIKVGRPDYSHSDEVGIKRSVMDDSGFVRNEIEL